MSLALDRVVERIQSKEHREIKRKIRDLGVPDFVVVELFSDDTVKFRVDLVSPDEPGFIAETYSYSKRYARRALNAEIVCEVVKTFKKLLEYRAHLVPYWEWKA